MTLTEFIDKKPPNLRLGQWFVNCYCKATQVGNSYYWEEIIDKLWSLDGEKAKIWIDACMINWQWDDLPEPRQQNNA